MKFQTIDGIYTIFYDTNSPYFIKYGALCLARLESKSCQKGKEKKDSPYSILFHNNF